MDMTLEKEKRQEEQERVKLYIQYLSNVFSQQIDDSKFQSAKKEFEQLIRPEKQADKGLAQTYEWDFNPEEVLEQQKKIEGR
ncbi:hypothetical protein ACFSMW_13540 [Virgibacillus halophilus]|uniref:hypothetical protein n=1 Tax=Tigheibacillus halophilus TaxID=361280 RepID=UPI0036283721